MLTRIPKATRFPAKQTPEVAHGVKVVRLDRADRASHDRRDFPMRQLVVHAQDDDRPLPGWRLRDSRPQPGCALEVIETLDRIDDTPIYLAVDLHPLGLRPLHADPVQTQVYPDAIQPGREGGLRAKAAQPAMCPQEDLLRQVARVLVVAREAIASW